jgi:hypothetical protein
VKTNEYKSNDSCFIGVGNFIGFMSHFKKEDMQTGNLKTSTPVQQVINELGLVYVEEGALAYFVGGDPEYKNDNGFALKPWVKARYDNAGGNNEGIQIYGSVAITMGNVWVTDKAGKEVMVDKTWVFKKGKDGKLRIIVHKSALP